MQGTMSPVDLALPRPPLGLHLLRALRAVVGREIGRFIRQPSRLGMGNCFTLCPSAHSEPDLGKLGGFARSCLSADNNHRMLLDRQCDILPSGTDREVFRELNLH